MRKGDRIFGVFQIAIAIEVDKGVQEGIHIRVATGQHRILGRVGHLDERALTRQQRTQQADAALIVRRIAFGESRIHIIITTFLGARIIIGLAIQLRINTQSQV